MNHAIARRIQIEFIDYWNCWVAGACQSLWLDYRLGVSFEEIKNGLAELPVEQQDQLAAHLVDLRHKRNARSHRELSSRLDDQNPDHWISTDQLREHWRR